MEEGIMSGCMTRRRPALVMGRNGGGGDGRIGPVAWDACMRMACKGRATAGMTLRKATRGGRKQR
jgi:hypothetical protein